MSRLSKFKSDDKVSMFVVGIDLHKNYLQIAVMNKEGRVLRNSKIDNNLKQVSRFFNDVNGITYIGTYLRKWLNNYGSYLDKNK